MKELRLDVNETVRVVVCDYIRCIGFISKVEVLPPEREIIGSRAMLREFGDIRVTIKVTEEDLGCDQSVIVTSV